MDLVVRDTRHLRGTTPAVTVAPPRDEGHVVSLDHGEGTASLLVRTDDGTLHRLPVVDRIHLEVLDERKCVGRHTDSGLVACPWNAPADRFDRCPSCHPLPDRDCVFNPRCPECTLDFCRGPHRLYLAFYGELPKVGMTRAARGEDRLVEQGADAFAFLATASDRAEARRLEDLVTRRLGIPQARRADELLTRTARRTPWTAIENAYQGLVPRLGALLGSAPGPLQRLFDPDEAPFPVVPTLAGIVGHHAGRVLGVKGRYLFYRVTAQDPETAARAPIWALNLSAVVTHRVRFDLKDAAPN